jgi:hypothetical protein
VGGVRGLRFKKGVTMRIFRIFLQEAFSHTKGLDFGWAPKNDASQLGAPSKEGYAD